MSAWPENPYLAEFLRSPEGQAYLEKYGNLEAWKRRHLLDRPEHGPDVIMVSTDQYMQIKDGLWGAQLQALTKPQKDEWEF